MGNHHSGHSSVSVPSNHQTNGEHGKSKGKSSRKSARVKKRTEDNNGSAPRDNVTPRNGNGHAPHDKLSAPEDKSATAVAPQVSAENSSPQSSPPPPPRPVTSPPSLLALMYVALPTLWSVSPTHTSPLKLNNPRNSMSPNKDDLEDDMTPRCLNDDHLFPDAVTPSKVEPNLRQDDSQYDIPFMDDEVYIHKNWYRVASTLEVCIQNPMLANMDEIMETSFTEILDQTKKKNKGANNKPSSSSSHPQNKSPQRIQSTKSPNRRRLGLCGCMKDPDRDKA